MVAAARMKAADVPAVLPEPTPQGGPGWPRSTRGCPRGPPGPCRPRAPRPARRRNRRPAAASRLLRGSPADSAARPGSPLAGPAPGRTSRQLSRPARGRDGRKERHSRSPAGLTGTAGSRGAACGYLFRRHGRRTGQLGGMAPACADGQHVPGCGDREPERQIRPGHADAASRDRPPQRCSMRHRTAHNAAAAYLGNPIPGMALTHTAQTRQHDYRRQAGHRALNSGTNLSQPTRPVRVIFRRHTASVLHHLAEGWRPKAGVNEWAWFPAS